MTNRFVRHYQKLRDRLGGRRKLALAIVGAWIAFELIAAAAVAIAGKEWIESGPARAQSDRGGTTIFGASRPGASIARF